MWIHIKCCSKHFHKTMEMVSLDRVRNSSSKFQNFAVHHNPYHSSNKSTEMEATIKI